LLISRGINFNASFFECRKGARYFIATESPQEARSGDSNPQVHLQFQIRAIFNKTMIIDILERRYPDQAHCWGCGMHVFPLQVGDDVFGEDPMVNALGKKISKLFVWMEAGLFWVASGTMTNQIAIAAPYNEFKRRWSAINITFISTSTRVEELWQYL